MIRLSNPAHKAEYKRLQATYGEAVATRYAIIVTRPLQKGKGGAWTSFNPNKKS